MGSALPSEIQYEVFEHAPFGALNGIARTCRKWRDAVEHNKRGYIRSTFLFQMEDEDASWSEYPNGVRHGRLEFRTDAGEQFQVKYVDGVATYWVCDSTECNPSFGRVGSNIIIVAEVWRQLSRIRYSVHALYDTHVIVAHDIARGGAITAHEGPRWWGCMKNPLTGPTKACQHFCTDGKLDYDAIASWMNYQIHNSTQHRPDLRAAMLNPINHVPDLGADVDVHIMQHAPELRAKK